MTLLIVGDFALKPLRAPSDEDLHNQVAAKYDLVAIILKSDLDLSKS